MRERPEKWEVICKICFAGVIMSDEEVTKRLDYKNGNGRDWPNHCDQVMQLRHVMGELPKEDCTHAGCWSARNSLCGCLCRGRNHGVMNPNPQFTKVKVAEPKKWWNIPIKRFITV